MAKVFPAELLSLIEEKGYLPEQVFNADETGLFWKKMLTRMFISQRESKVAGFKAAKDSVSLLLCVNAEGDFMVTLMMLSRSDWKEGWWSVRNVSEACGAILYGAA